MPLTAKGQTILTHMREQYGAKEGTSNFYASINSGRITGAERDRPSRRRRRQAAKEGK